MVWVTTRRSRRAPDVPEPTSILDAIRRGTLDAELAGLLWTLLDAGMPLIVAGPGDTPQDLSQRRTILDLVLDLAPADRVRRTLSPVEDFPWLAGVESLGWRRTAPVPSTRSRPLGRPVGRPVGRPAPDAPARDLLLAGELGAAPPADTIGERVRLVIRALGLGFGLGATVRGSRLEDVLELLRAQPIGVTDDELSRLGVVLVLAAGDGAEPTKVAAAHYLRPLARDVHGHSQRLPPAVLATWEPGRGRFEHFAWGVAAELADRLGRRTGDFELDRARRAEALTGLAAVHLPDRAAERVVLERFRRDSVGAGWDGRPS